jgi:hypothetical protein
MIVFDIVAKIMVVICVLMKDDDLTRKGFNTLMIPFGYVCYIPSVIKLFMKNLRGLE